MTSPAPARTSDPPSVDWDAPAPWGRAPTPLLPTWYLTTHGEERLPQGFTKVYPRVQRVRDLERFWDFYGGPLETDASWALRNLAQALMPPEHLQVLDAGVEPQQLDDLPLKIRTRNCLRRGHSAGSGGTVGMLMRLPNFGITSLLDLMCVLEVAALHGIHPGRDLSQGLDSAKATEQPRPDGQGEPSAPHADAWNLIAAAAQEFRGASTLGDLLRLDLSDLVAAAGADAALDEAPLEAPDSSLSGRAVSSVQACLESMPEVQRLVAVERAVASEPKTLEQLAATAGLSRERMRQLDRKARAQLAGTCGPTLGLLALVAAQRLGPVTTETEIENQVVALLPESPDEPLALEAARRLLFARLDYECRNGICLNGAAAHAAETLKDGAGTLLDDAGLIDADELRGRLDPELHDHWTALVGWIGWHFLSDHIVPRVTARARVKAALLKIGTSATKAQIAEESSLTEQQVAGALSNIDSVARADKHRWGLRDWIDDVYEGIPAEIVQRINEDGGSTRLNRVLDELPRLFGVSETSVWAYLNTPAFRVEHGWVAEAAEADIQIGHLDDVVSGRDREGRPYWTFEVASRHLDGYSLHGVPPEIAAALGCQFGGRSSAAVRSPAGCQNISIIWRKTSMHGPEIGRLSQALASLQAHDGATMSLIIHGPGAVEFAHSGDVSRSTTATAHLHPSPSWQAPQTGTCQPFGGVRTADPLHGSFRTAAPETTDSREQDQSHDRREVFES